MLSLWLFFLRKKVFTYFLMFVLVSGGLYSLVAIPKESAPEVVVPVGIISTVLRGASAQDIEKLVTNKLEEEVINAEDIEKVTSVSREGVSVITAQFDASADIETSIDILKEAVDKAKTKLPEDATDPIVTKVNFSEQPILILSVSQDASPASLRKLGEDLERELKKVAGVSSVSITGTRKKEIQVVVRKDKLASYGLSLNQVVAAIQGANASLPIGSITVSDIDYPIKFSGSIEEASEVSDITVTSPSGATVYLRDIAFMADGLAPPSTYSRTSLNSEPSQNAITLNIYKKSGGDITVITDAVKEKLEDMKEDLLMGSNVVVSFDAGSEVKKDLRQLTRVGLETVLLVMVMLFLTIGWRESLVAGLSIPLSFVIAFIGLYVSGNTINFISLFSLILAIGILVDSGIVIAEAIHTRSKKYPTIKDAAIASLKEYSWPLIAGTMTTVVVFAPLFFLSGVTGQFISSIPFTIIFVLIASIVVALGMVPLLAIALSKNEIKENKFTQLQEEWFHKAQDWYKAFLRKMLENHKSQKNFLRLLGVLFFVSLLLPITGLLRVQFFPQDDQNFIYISVEKQQGTPLAQTDIVVRQVEELLYEEQYISSFVTTVGASSVFSSSGGSANTKVANITVLLKEDREKTSSELIEVVRKKLTPINDAVIKVDQGNNGPPSGAPVLITFKGDDLEKLSLVADKAEGILKNIKGTIDVETSLRDDGSQFDIEIDKVKASQVGLSALAVSQTLRAAVSGVTASTITKQGEDVDIIVKVDLNSDFVNPEDTIKTTVDALKQMLVATPSGSVPLGSLITISLGESRSTINHEEGKRITRVTSNLDNAVTALEVVNEFKKHEEQLGLTKDIEVQYGGENEDVQKTFTEMFLALLAGMAGMLAILVLEFNSLRYSLYLLLTIPLSLIGVLFGLTITGQFLSFSSMLGLIALAGVIINHAIILLDSILRKLEQDKSVVGASLSDVIVISSAIRLRPIFLTTVTTVVGMLPLAFASALWGPLAFAIMFGLSFAMVLTLVLIPVFFYRYPGEEYAHMKNEIPVVKESLKSKLIKYVRAAQKALHYVVSYVRK
ncbi:MAG: efflux RND transporter permease subunit [Candidatus Pacebacteria bacterium]|nr:efflux RND transporter permease subunit [Candidatus Paceibacterota bacterium]